MNIYKRDGLVLSSFEKFNGSRAGYQQLPWIANLDGVGMWSLSGAGSESLSGFSLLNTHNPFVVQRQNVAVISYAA